MTDVGEPGVPPDGPATDRYLERLEVHLRMPPEAAGNVLDEVAAHIDDAIAAGMLEGLTPDAAERRALDRLGPPDALGKDLRRTHQTRRRLLAAAGSGVWHGTQGLVRGWFGGYIVALPVLLVALYVAQIGQAVFGFRNGVSTANAIFDVAIWLAVWGAAWVSARTIVEAVSRRSLRSIESIRTPLAVGGAALVAVPAILLPADHSLLSVAMAIATPFVFGLGARSVDAAFWDRFGPPAWERRVPRLRRIAFVGFILVILAPFAAIPLGMSTGSVEVQQPEPESMSAAERWAAAGYTIVAPKVIDYDEIYLASGWTKDGWILGNIPDDRVDWDDFPGLRFEVWRAMASTDHDPRGRLLGNAPMAVVPVTDPWTRHEIAVQVGYPGADAFALFLVAEDPVTHARVAFGHPEGDESRFHGSVIDWFLQS